MSRRKQSKDATGRVNSHKSYQVTSYDSELARLAVERNNAYETMYEVEKFAKKLSEGEYSNIGVHLLTILYGEDGEISV